MNTDTAVKLLTADPATVSDADLEAALDVADGARPADWRTGGGPGPVWDEVHAARAAANLAAHTR